jgi:hypothetical protein
VTFDTFSDGEGVSWWGGKVCADWLTRARGRVALRGCWGLRDEEIRLGSSSGHVTLLA